MNHYASHRWFQHLLLVVALAFACNGFACDENGTNQQEPDGDTEDPVDWEYPDPYADGDQIDWVIETGSTYARLPAVDANGGLLFGDWNGVVRRVDATTGAVDWTFEAAGRIDSAPAVEDGRVYFADWAGIVYALDGGGQEIWTHDVEAAVDASPSIDTEGRIWIGDLHGFLHVFSHDGDLQHSYDLEAPVVSAASIAAHNDGWSLFVATADDKVHCLSDDSDPNSVTLQGEVGFDLALTDNGDAIATTENGGIARVSPTCEIVWQENLTWATLMPASIGDGDDLWVWGHNRQFYRLDATSGATDDQWGAPIRSNATTAPTLTDDQRVLVSTQGVVSFDGSDSVILTDLDAMDSPVLTDGAAFVTTERGVVLRLAGSWPSLGHSSWPTQHGNLARTGRLDL